MKAERPVETRTDWGDAMRGLAYCSGGMGLGLIGLVDAVNYGLKSEHADVGVLAGTGAVGIIYGAFTWFITWSVREKEVYPEGNYRLIESSDNKFKVEELNDESKLLYLIQYPHVTH